MLHATVPAACLSSSAGWSRCGAGRSATSASTARSCGSRTCPTSPKCGSAARPATRVSPGCRSIDRDRRSFPSHPRCFVRGSISRHSANRRRNWCCAPPFPLPQPPVASGRLPRHPCDSSPMSPRYFAPGTPTYVGGGRGRPTCFVSVPSLTSMPGSSAWSRRARCSASNTRSSSGSGS
jgi:hypothetical protein